MISQYVSAVFQLCCTPTVLKTDENQPAHKGVYDRHQLRMNVDALHLKDLSRPPMKVFDRREKEREKLIFLNLKSVDVARLTLIQVLSPNGYYQ